MNGGRTKGEGPADICSQTGLYVPLLPMASLAGQGRASACLAHHAPEGHFRGRLLFLLLLLLVSDVDCAARPEAALFYFSFVCLFACLAGFDRLHLLYQPQRVGG